MVRHDTITKYLSSEVALNNYPQPAIGLRFTYNGIQDVVGKSVVVRTMTKANGRTDATFTVVSPESSDMGVVAYTPGAFIDSKTSLHGHLQPGNVMPLTCNVYGAHLSKGGVYFWGIPTSIYRPANNSIGKVEPISGGTYLGIVPLQIGEDEIEC